MRPLWAALVLVFFVTAHVDAQDTQQPVGDTLRLDALHAAALRNDPRFEQLELQRAQSQLRLRSIEAERLPSLALDGQAQYQSDVTKLPVVLPGGPAIPVPKNVKKFLSKHKRKRRGPSADPRRFSATLR